MSRQLRNQTGMVSIMVTLIVMLVITLIVLGFAQVSRREQRQTLDRQLSTQAFFAAESGINDAKAAIVTAFASGSITEVPEKTVCDPQGIYSANQNVDAAHNVKYTCLLVTTKLDDIQIKSLAAEGNSTTVPIEPDGVISTLRIKWEAPSPPLAAAWANCNANATAPFDAVTSWPCPFGVLRMDMVPTAVLSRAALVAQQRTMFLYPTKNGAGSQPYLTARGVIPAMDCGARTSCTIDITGVPPGNYALRLNALYVGGSVTIQALDPSGAVVPLKNAQVQVDVTGRAQDVLRRIRVRLPLAVGGQTPDYAIESGSSICKRFEVDAAGLNIANDIQGQDPNNPMCTP